MKQNYAVYKEIGINTSQPLKLVIMLYDGAITYLNKSIEYAENKDIKNKNIYANKARDIILELNNSLNLEVGGEMASNLKRLYFFMNRHLFQANLKNDTKGMREVILMLSDLREVWQEIYQNSSDINQTAPSQTEYGTAYQSGIRV